MNLVIDIGNSRSKLAVFKDNQQVALTVYNNSIGINDVNKFLEKHKGVKRVILSSVVKHSLKTTKLDASTFPGIDFIELKSDTPLPIENLYKTPETLGPDRIAVVVGANNKFPNENILVIDAGTCITYDFINSQNRYLGGSISPGINMRFRALNNFTAKLPLLSPDKSWRFKKITGVTTDESILSGVLNGTLSEIKGIIEVYRNKFPELKILLTGGDLVFFENELKNDIFADPTLILKGLNEILNYN